MSGKPERGVVYLATRKRADTNENEKGGLEARPE